MRFFLVLLIVAYLSTLIMSTGHLAEWYAMSLGGLPRWFALGLAASLELSAFLLSLLSNSYLRRSAWAGGGALAALSLVWAGNLLSMHRAAASLPLWEVGLSSLFVPVGTYVVGKVVGELLERSASVVGRSAGVQGAVQGLNGSFSLGVQGLNGPFSSVQPVEHSVQPGRSVFERPVQPSPPSVQSVQAERSIPSADVQPTVQPAFSEVDGTEQGVFRESSRVERTHERIEHVRELKLSEKALVVLEALRSGPLPLAELSRRTGLPKSSLSFQLHRLAEMGLLERAQEGWRIKEE